MKREHFDLLKEEGKALGIVAVVVFVVLLIVFYKSGFFAALRMTLAGVWLFVIPGILLMLSFRDKLGRMERMVMGALLSAAILGISSYYVGLAGLNIKYHAMVFPLVLDAIGIILMVLKGAEAN